MGATASVLGASGFTGGELARLLAEHPAITATALGASSRAGSEAAAVLPHLTGAGTGTLTDVDVAAAAEADVCFSCLPSGLLEPLLDSIQAGVIIDLADDFRRDPGWAYGLTELNRAAVAGATRISNPGCYPTASLLCLVPFLAAGVIDGPISIDALSGSSGAGRAEAGHLMLSELGGNVSAYGATNHRHVPEIEHWLGAFAGASAAVSFTPHLVPMARGLLVTARAPLTSKLSGEAALQVLRDVYVNEPLVDVIEGWPSTKPLNGTSRAHVSARVDERCGLVIASAAIDNLGKGAAGQALQNANLALGIEETTGLTAYGVWP
jgi:N-acetyl-gamma-glutamyl-phosphate reductase